MSNKLKARNGIPFDFVDGLYIKGVEVSKWAKVTRGTSDSRPVLTADEFGVMFIDNTLSANGKPIWWTGAAWVDSTGAIV